MDSPRAPNLTASVSASADAAKKHQLTPEQKKLLEQAEEQYFDDPTGAAAKFEELAIQGCVQAYGPAGQCHYTGYGVSRDFAYAIRWLKKAVKNDPKNVLALNQLGVCYFKRGLFTDANKCFETAQKEYLSPEATYAWGKMFATGQGVTENQSRATECFLQLAEQGHVRAMCWLGNVFGTGKGVAADLKQVAHWCEKAADLGSVRAMAKIASIYESSAGVSKDLDVAFGWYLKAAKKKHASSMYKVAQKYAVGEGTKQETDKAVKWYLKTVAYALTVEGVDQSVIEPSTQYILRSEEGKSPYEIALKYRGSKYDKVYWHWIQQAVNSGHIEATLQLGIRHERRGEIDAATQCYECVANDHPRAAFRLGWLAERDGKVDQAIQRYESAANRDHERAMEALGELYIKRQDTKQAINWLGRAADHDSVNAMRKLVEIFQNGSGVSQDMVKAHEWLKRAADLGDAKAMFQWAEESYKNGEFLEAKKWYEKAALEHNCDSSTFKLGQMYQYGLGVKQDNGKACKHFFLVSKKCDEYYSHALRQLGHYALNAATGQLPTDSALDIKKRVITHLSIAYAGSNAQAAFSLGEIYLNDFRYSQALFYLEEAIRLKYPETKELTKMLTLIELALGRLSYDKPKKADTKQAVCNLVGDPLGKENYFYRDPKETSNQEYLSRTPSKTQSLEHFMVAADYKDEVAKRTVEFLLKKKFSERVSEKAPDQPPKNESKRALVNDLDKL